LTAAERSIRAIKMMGLEYETSLLNVLLRAMAVVMVFIVASLGL